MNEGRLPKEIMKWQPKGWKEMGGPKLTWMDDIQNMIQND
jgi:hypothetical protein